VSLHGLGAIARKELRDILRERTILVAIVVQLFIAGFSTFLVVGLSALYDPATVQRFPVADIAYAGPDGDDPVLEALGSARNLRLERMDAQSAQQAFVRGEADAAIAAVRAADGTWRVTLLLPEPGIQSTLLLTQLKAVLGDLQLDLRQQAQERLQSPVLEVAPPTGRPPLPFAFAYATLLPILVLTPVFLAGATASDSVVQERQDRTLLLLRASPVPVAQVLLGKLLVPVLLAPLQVALWTALLALNGIPVQGVPVLLGATAAAALALASVGVAIAAWAQRPGQAQAAYALAALALAVGSLLLPRTPANALALAATGGMDGAAWLTFGAVAAAAILAAAVALPWVARRLGRDA
jgi:ABC-2 type transport system permease protein